MLDWALLLLIGGNTMPQRRLQWRGASNGPDWKDVHSFLRDVEKTHVCTVYLHLQPVGHSNASAWQVTAVAHLHSVPLDGHVPTVAVAGTFPHRDHATLSGLCYALLVKLDWDIGSDAYEQISFA